MPAAQELLVNAFVAARQLAAVSFTGDEAVMFLLLLIFGRLMAVQTGDALRAWALSSYS